MSGLFVHLPFRLRQRRGAVAVIDDQDQHLRDKILTILFTAPGERVNEPRFGVGLDRAVFEPLDELTIAGVEFRMAEGLRRDLGNEAIIDGLDVEVDRGQVTIRIDYRRRIDRVRRILAIEL